eukprot:m.117182 g.117182  ORF g.117182 m.117182 type:complete len:110 (-) comp13176_c0_seq5:2444-2773(-)
MNLRHLLQQDPPTTNANLSDELRSTLSPLPKDTLCHDHMHLPLHPLLHHSGWLQKPRPRCTARQTERMRSASNLISAGGTSRRSPCVASKIIVESKNGAIIVGMVTSAG